MRVRQNSGFSLVEVLIAISLTGIVGAAVFFLLDVGLKAHDSARELSMDVVGASETATRLRADLARSSSVAYAGPDSLELALPNGDAVAYASRLGSVGVELYRSIRSGGQWKENPMRPLALLSDGHGESGRIDFEAVGSQRVRARIWTNGRPFVVEGSLWRTP